MKLVITIDTEEDDWSDYSRDGSRVTHAPQIERLQALFDEFAVRPTYLVTLPVVADRAASALLERTLRSGRCEIGSHCHPWNTRPFDEEINERNSMLSNLPAELQLRKMLTLHEAIRRRFGVTPVSFRCGRWGYNSDVAGNLVRLGYKVDTSVTAYTDWSEYQGPDFSGMGPESFRCAPEDAFTASSKGPLLEVPATVGFLQKDFDRANSVLRGAGNPLLRPLRLAGVMHRLNLVNKVSLSPELADGASMVRLARVLSTKGYEVINMFFHSPSLKAGLTPFVTTREDEARFLGDIRELLAFARDSGIGSITLSEAAELL